jgi:drug/metabolite transporter (DMT)-like permease
VAAALALLSSVFWGGADFLGGLLSRRLPAVAVVAYSQAVGMVVMLAVVVLTGERADPSAVVGWAALAGAAGTLGLVCFYSALAGGTMGVVSPIAALGVLVPVGVGLLGGDAPSRTQLLGMVLGLAGTVAASGPELSGAAGRRSLVLAIAAGAMFGLTMVAIDGGSDASPLLTTAGMRVTSVAMFLAAALVARRWYRPAVADGPALALVGIGDAGANVLFGVASTMGMVSVVAVVGSLYPVVTVILAGLLLHERLSAAQRVGVVAALAGVGLIALG